MLAERSSQMTINMHDIDNKRASITKLESDLTTEKVLMIKDLRVNRRDPSSPPPPTHLLKQFPMEPNYRFESISM